MFYAPYVPYTHTLKHMFTEPTSHIAWTKHNNAWLGDIIKRKRIRNRKPAAWNRKPQTHIKSITNHQPTLMHARICGLHINLHTERYSLARIICGIALARASRNRRRRKRNLETIEEYYYVVSATPMVYISDTGRIFCCTHSHGHNITHEARTAYCAARLRWDSLNACHSHERGNKLRYAFAATWNESETLLW